jgi:hypothetical protein
MTEYHSLEENGEVDLVEVEGAPGSVLAQLQSAAAAQLEEKTFDLPVGGAFKDLLEIRYRPLDPQSMDRYIAKRARIIDKGGELADISSTDASMDLMAQACVCLLARGEVLEVSDGVPYRLDLRLADLLEIPFPDGYEPSARDVILKLFGNNAMALDAHATRLLEWMREPVEVHGLGEQTADG